MQTQSPSQKNLVPLGHQFVACFQNNISKFMKKKEKISGYTHDASSFYSTINKITRTKTLENCEPDFFMPNQA